MTRNATFSTKLCDLIEEHKKDKDTGFDSWNLAMFINAQIDLCRKMKNKERHKFHMPINHVRNSND